LNILSKPGDVFCLGFNTWYTHKILEALVSITVFIGW